MSSNSPSQSTHPEVRDYLIARNYIDVELVRLEPRRRDPEGKVATALKFNEMLGNPQAAYPSVQVAGTSGKGSVCLALSQILVAAGQRTGLHVSPYLQVATEKTWIDRRYVSGSEFRAACETVRPVAEQFRYRDDCPTSVHGMASLALSYEAFRRRKIEWCVMETGVGGRFDLVQGLQRRLAVITDIGLDHVKALGGTRAEIAWHKAGIMAGCETALAVYDPELWPIFVAEAERQGCRLVPVVPESRSQVHQTSSGPLLLINLTHLGEIEIPWPHPPDGFHRRNAVVAASAADLLFAQGVPITADAVRQGLLSRPMPGRLEQVQEGPEVLLDGAHNGQKMAALLRSLPPPRGVRHLVIGATGARHFSEVLGAFKDRPASVMVTRPLLFGKSVADPSEMAGQVAEKGALMGTDSCPTRAMRRVLQAATPEDQILVTGSLYLVGQMRNIWYPWDDVLRQQTSWPKARCSTLASPSTL
jgi:dihydrofolate synthase / folylpolyglutamate synthase